jgi:hypothetical protein
MDDPIKIIFKYKNNYRRVQYNINIFVGDVTQKMKQIFNKMKELTLFDTFIKLSMDEINKLEKDYGKLWFNKFFNTYHINASIFSINNNDVQKNELVKKYGKKWFTDMIESYSEIDQKLFYSYDSMIKNEKMLHVTKKDLDIDTDINQEKIDDNISIDYRTIKYVYNNFLSRIPNRIENEFQQVDDEFQQVDNEFQQVGGSFKEMLKQYKYEEKYENFLQRNKLEENKLEENKLEENKLEENKLEENKLEEDKLEENKLEENKLEGGKIEGEEIEDGINEKEEDGINELEFDDIIEDTQELEEIEKMYESVDVNEDKNIKETSKLINKALEEENIYEKMKKEMNKFDSSNDENQYDEKLKNVYKKTYVYSQYILKDDTIQNIKNKISCSLLNNEKFAKSASNTGRDKRMSYLIPSRLHMWSEYYFNNRIEKVMIGQKWIKKTEILQIDIEPNNNMRYYEELLDKMKLLKDNLKRYGSKIKREDDEHMLLYDYDNYYTNNEIYMIDIYNEFGKDYSPEEEKLKNVTDLYCKLYFPRIKQEDIKYIIEYLNGKTSIEENKVSIIYETIYNDIIIENEIMKTIIDAKKNEEYKKIFKENYITQSVIHLILREKNNRKINLFRIFNEFQTTDKYPFLQYQLSNGQIIFKFNDNKMQEHSKKKENKEIFTKWFETSPYGISFKVKLLGKSGERFMAINLNENGRLDYKTSWKEEDLASIEDIKKTYNLIRELIGKINNEKNKINFYLPEDIEFKYAFINSIQKFELPKKYVIDHNDLSEFSRYFYPYVSLIIDPKKRESKLKKNEISKFGTYLRYKRISRYENNTKIEYRILYFMRNYEYKDQTLAEEIGRQFNITNEIAMQHIENIRSKYKNIKMARKVLKKIEEVPRYKPPGIQLDIQGKSREKYKIRISGARDQCQMNRILSFMNVLLFLYVETYLDKKP